MMKIILSIMFFLMLPILSFAQEVSPFDQCKHYVNLVIKEKNRTMIDLATHMARVEILEREKKGLEDKIKAMEAGNSKSEGGVKQ